MNQLQVMLSDECSCLAVSGEIDAATVHEFVSGLEAASEDVRVDLRGCSFMDSSGVAALVAFKAGGCPGLSVTAVSEPVRVVLATTGLLDVLCESEGAEGCA